MNEKIKAGDVVTADIENPTYASEVSKLAMIVGYYRNNLHRFAAEYLGLTRLTWFQKILMWMFQKYDNSLLLACRGSGKTRWYVSDGHFVYI